jgi:prepilin-type N-terminal cleavage/methylation domain-containing protein
VATHESGGFTLIECLVALLVLAVGALGAVGTIALAWRMEEAGDRAARVARLGGSVLDSLRGVVVAGDGRCDAVSGGTSDARNAGATWVLAPSAGGREVMLTLWFRSLGGTATDSAWTFIPCH